MLVFFVIFSRLVQKYNGDGKDRRWAKWTEMSTRELWSTRSIFGLMA